MFSLSDDEEDIVYWDEKFKSDLLDTMNTNKEAMEFTFAVGGVNKNLHPLPGINILNYGIVNLPVTETTITSLKQHFVRASDGLGQVAVDGKKVKGTWELDLEKFEIENQIFKDEVENLANIVKDQIECSKENVTCHLYKLLLHEPGGHFKPHGDTAKFPGMFATLIIQLPSVFAGGDLIVKHGDRETSFTFGGIDSQYYCKYAAYYENCEHELSEITSGYRLSLVYALCWDGNGIAPRLPRTDIPTNELVKLLGQLEEKLPLPHLFGWALENKYSAESFLGHGVDCLKGGDQCVYTVLQKANTMLEEDKKLSFLIIDVEKYEEVYGFCDKPYASRRYGDKTPDCDKTCFHSDYSDGTMDDYELKAFTPAGDEASLDLLIDYFEELVHYLLNERVEFDYNRDFWVECHKGKCPGAPSTYDDVETRRDMYRRCVLLVLVEKTIPKIKNEKKKKREDPY